MTFFFPDINVWMALSVEGHPHGDEAREWLLALPDSAQLLFCRFTQLGLLRLLTNPVVMGEKVLKAQDAWKVYDHWFSDPRVDLHPEPLNVEMPFREATASLSSHNVSNWFADCYLLTFAKSCGATLVTFDKALLALAAKRSCRAIRC